MLDDVATLANPAVGLQSRAAFCVIVPAYNEATGLDEFHRRLTSVMDGLARPWTVLYVNDGSTDDTLRVLRGLRARDPRVALINLSRNFGKEAAMTAGLDHADADAIIVIDSDLQDPPEVIPELVAAWRDGYDIVYAQRSVRQGETWLKKTTATLFYRLMADVGKAPMPRNTGDFRLMSWRVVEALRTLREGHRFMKGLFAWVGFPSKAVLYERAPRHTGSTTWNYWKLWNFAIEGITSFTVMPLKVASYLGLAVSVLAAMFILQLVVRTILFGNPVAGYPSLMAVVLFLGGVQLLTLGVIGEYLGRIFNETKQRPLYLIESFQPPESV
ncbi:MAG TPA: glycosyltransferase family 2 protein [Rhodopila sp.]|jgi:glycosyltransferase involved in cell wall biosynthesis|nr:glycosyltransferase family 2 protein [Rhodopila sp.]